MKDDGKYIYTVSQLTSSIKIILEDSFKSIWVDGEISNFKASGGHFYFTLKDGKSELKCVFFRSSNEKVKFEIKDGMQVLCCGKISIYEQRGVYQLYVAKMEPKGVGELQLAFEQLKERLFKEGLFDEAHKKDIPLIPEKIGIVTSVTGAAIRDILQVLNKRFSNIEVIISPVRVQGDGAKEDIAAAIEEFNRLKNVDVLIVGRGGGSLEDLWAFNEEIVARAIYNSKIPVISAVGHEIDWTISDFAADKRAPTPSVAAEMVIAKKSELSDRLDEIEKKIRDFPMDMVMEYEQRLDDIEDNMALRFSHYIELKEGDFRLLLEKLQILSPVGILDRGYSISFRLPDRKIIKSAKDLKAGDFVETKVSKGSFKSRIE
ncbi:MAG: exodeoxyribonuclease VII large subunit [Candidatus Omnitrophota bacterium]|nr:exodeoxyribonuclease VII large subunit [Candidatus Omnitrophota bacterium]